MKYKCVSFKGMHIAWSAFSAWLACAHLFMNLEAHNVNVTKIITTKTTLMIKKMTRMIMVHVIQWGCSWLTPLSPTNDILLFLSSYRCLTNPTSRTIQLVQRMMMMMVVSHKIHKNEWDWSKGAWGIADHKTSRAVRPLFKIASISNFPRLFIPFST